MEILSAAEMKLADRATVERFGGSWPALMEAAGLAVARFALKHFSGARKVLVLAGKGNNGGDSLIAARHLVAAGCEVAILLLAKPEALSGEAAGALKRLSTDGLKGRPISITTAEQLDSANISRLFHDSQLILDGVFGTGFKPPLEGIAAAVRERVQQSPARVLAIDLPSGWDADSPQFSADAFRADAVVTFTRPKTAHAFGNLTEGPVVVAPIGSPDSAIESSSKLFWAGASKSVIDTPRGRDGNKGKFGHVLLIAGSRGKSGAPSMSSLAALRIGAGLVTAAVPSSILNTVSRIAPELMTEPLEETTSGTVSIRNLEAGNLNPLLEKKSVLAVGPGLSQNPETVRFIQGLLLESQLPLVLDADGLNAFAGKASQLNGLNAAKADGPGRTLVLTPHPGEMARLLGSSVKDVEADRVNLARSFAVEHHLTLVLKGWRTLIAQPDGRVFVNTTGNPGMAKGGSGDLLTGMVAGMLAQHPDHGADAVNAAVYLHGLAGDLAADRERGEWDEHTLLATDSLKHLPAAYRLPVTDADGFTWIQRPVLR